ncbi:hypothetical protein [Microbacterium sp. YY-01]|uniref:hypothetical protein n=1 Tax=Microbacterium sp. YY-01 TaxID=3421634 RepID=UPI003D17D3DA
MSSLRAELLGQAPASGKFRMLLPPGWEQHSVSKEDEQQLVRRAGEKLARAHRPDLFAQLSSQVAEMMAGLRERNAIAYAFAGEASPTWALGAASLVGVLRTGDDEVSLDALVRHAIDNFDAQPLGDDYRIVRWVERHPVTIGDESVVSTTINYLIPVPRTYRKKAVQWVVTVPHPDTVAADDPRLAQWVALFDAHIATMEWEQSA